MAAGHAEALPTIALQLALQLERYRAALEALAADPKNTSPRDGLTQAVRSAAALANAIPAVWASWGDLVVRHATFMSAWLRSAPEAELRHTWRQVEDRSEIMAQRCVDWALRQQNTQRLMPAVATRLAAWDQARRDAFAAGRRLEAMKAIGLPPSELADLQARLESARDNCRQLQAWAQAALDGADAAQGASPPVARQAWLDFEALHERWRVAEEAAVAAELCILEMELKRQWVPSAQRQRAAELRDAAHACRAAVFAAGRL